MRCISTWGMGALLELLRWVWSHCTAESYLGNQFTATIIIPVQVALVSIRWTQLFQSDWSVGGSRYISGA